MKKFLPALAVLLLAAAPARADITIGIAGPFSGENAFFGEQMRHGAEQFIADVNGAGGINGQKIVLRYADDACDPKQAVAVANQLASAGIKFVVGHACSSASIPASKVYNEEGMLMVTPISTNPALTSAGFRGVFRTCGRDDQQGSVLGAYMLKHFRGKKVAVTHDQSAWGLGIAQELKKTLNAGGMQEAMFESFTPGERDYSAFISKLKQAGIEVVFLGGYYTAVGLIVRQMKEQGANIQVLTGDASVSDQLWSITGPAAEGMLMSFGPDPRKRPEAKTVLEAMRKKGFEPEGYTLYTYAALQVTAEGIRRVGVADPAKAAAANRTAPVPTVLGPLNYDENGDVKGANYVIYRWHNGKYAETED